MKSIICKGRWGILFLLLAPVMFLYTNCSQSFKTKDFASSSTKDPIDELINTEQTQLQDPILNSGWTYDSATNTASASTTSSSLIYDLTSLNLTVGQTYEVQFDWQHASGTLYVGLGSTQAGTASVKTLTSSGLARLILTMGADNQVLQFYGGAVSGRLSQLTLVVAASTPPPSESSTLVRPGPYDIDDPILSRISGPVFDNHTLSNITVGGPGTKVDALWYFKATQSSTVNAIRIFFTAIGDAYGYSHGNGGIIRMRIYPTLANGIQPDKSKPHLGESTYIPRLVAGHFPSGASEHELHVFSGGAGPLVKGQRYVVLFENLDTNYQSNFISVDMFGFAANSTLSEWIKNSDWGSAAQWGTTLEDRGQTTSGLVQKPCMEIHYANGTKFGIASIITGNIHDGTTERVTVATSTRPVRERIRLSASRNLIGAYLYTSARSGGSFIWSLKRGNEVLASGTQTAIAESSIFLVGLEMYKHGRHYLDFQKPIALAAGTNYDLEIVPTGATQLLMAANHDGRAVGYTGPFAAPESVAQFYNGSAWVYASSNPTAYGVTTPLGSWPIILVRD